MIPMLAEMIRPLLLLLGMLVACGPLQSPLLAEEFLRLAEGEGNLSPGQPQACVAVDGTTYVVFGVADRVAFCKSVDDGKSFTAPRDAVTVPNLSLGMRRGPRIAVSQGSLVITAIGGQKGKGQDGDLLAWRSADGGESWSGPSRVNDVAASAREGLHAMTVAPDGSFWCVWLDLRSKKTELYAARSRDGGASWSDNSLVYRSPAGSICECCHPSIAIDDHGIHVMFRNSLAGDRDLYLVSSRDQGLSFGPAIALSRDRWALNACPMDGGMLASDGSGTITAVWRREGQLFRSTLDLDQHRVIREEPIGEGEQPWVASTSRGPVMVWTEGRAGRLRMKSDWESETQLLDRRARDPILVSRPGGAGVVALWESLHDGVTSIRVARFDPQEPD